MRAFRMEVVIVETEGEFWLCPGPGRAIRLSKPPELVSLESASAVVKRLVSSQEGFDAARDDIAKERAWRKRLHILAYRVLTVRRAKPTDLDWARRINSCAVAVRQMIRRGSNLMGKKQEQFKGWQTWDEVFKAAKHSAYNPVIGDRQDGWGFFFNSRASNIRKRFRGLAAGTLATPPNGRRSQRDGVASHAERPRDKMLFEWS